MTARRQFTFKMSQAGVDAVDHLAEHVAELGYPKPTSSDVARAVFHQVLNDKNVREKVTVLLCQQSSI
jgi:hypothetical protein